ncbi:MAG: BolA family protein [Pseudomonadota bacterium]
MSVGQTMRDKLTAAFEPSQMELKDESHKHEGHAGHDGRGESHFRLRMVSDAFSGKSRVERQRMVHRVLKEELADRVHALALTLKAPSDVT